MFLKDEMNFVNRIADLFVSKIRLGWWVDMHEFERMKRHKECELTRVRVGSVRHRLTVMDRFASKGWVSIGGQEQLRDAQ